MDIFHFVPTENLIDIRWYFPEHKENPLQKLDDRKNLSLVRQFFISTFSLGSVFDELTPPSVVVKHFIPFCCAARVLAYAPTVLQL